MDCCIKHCLADIAAAQCNWKVFPETPLIADFDVSVEWLTNSSKEMNRDDR